jgi:hypothetical protein
MRSWDNCLCLLQEIFTFRVSGLSTDTGGDSFWSHKALRPTLRPLCTSSFTRALQKNSVMNGWCQNLLHWGPANMCWLHPRRNKELHSIWLGIDKVYSRRTPPLPTLSACSVIWGPEYVGAIMVYSGQSTVMLLVYTVPCSRPQSLWAVFLKIFQSRASTVSYLVWQTNNYNTPLSACA